MPKSEMIVWCEPIHRAKMQVVAGDIEKALTWFKAKTGKESIVITLHPKHQNLPVPEGIAVNYLGGCLAWEIWLSDQDGVVADMGFLGIGKAKDTVGYPPSIMSTLTSEKITVDIIQPVTPTSWHTRRGAKRKALPLDLIRQLAGEGMGSKAIATQLKSHGLAVSYKTIQRILSGERLL